ncbi:MAG TPA: transcriptional repressor LexA [Planctomycetota bacterium]|nr:transcriptional repressor LexA [Planctomycetota bacterium]
MTAPITPRQLEVLQFLRRSVAERGFPPTIAEIAANFGMRSPNAAAQHLRLLKQKGAIEVTPGLSRGIRLVESAEALAPRTRATRKDIDPRGALPIVGRVAAGSPILAEENRDGDLVIDPAAFRPRADYLLRVVGDSMVGAGILDGDLVAVHRTPEASSGAIAVVRVGGDSSGEVTVKRFRRSGPRVTLSPSNPRLRPREIDLREEPVAIEGVVVGVVRTGMSEKASRR